MATTLIKSESIIWKCICFTSTAIKTTCPLLVKPTILFSRGWKKKIIDWLQLVQIVRIAFVSFIVSSEQRNYACKIVIEWSSGLWITISAQAYYSTCALKVELFFYICEISGCKNISLAGTSYLIWPFQPLFCFVFFSHEWCRQNIYWICRSSLRCLVTELGKTWMVA